MTNPAQSRFSRRPHTRATALTLALAAAYPLAPMAWANTPAAAVHFATSDVSAVGADGKSQPLAKGGTVLAGQTIVTGNNGRAQVKFSDGGLMAFQPNTEFRIEEYAYNKERNQETMVTTLLKGTLRTVTGLIGKRNPQDYKLKTATATVGIRGTEFSLSYNPDGSLAISTGEGAVEVCTSAGCTILAAGESGLVTGNNSLPTRVRQNVTTPPPPNGRNEIDGQGDNAGGAGNNNVPAQVVTKRVLTGFAYTGFGVIRGATASTSYIRRYMDGTVSAETAGVTDPNGRPTQYLAAGNAADAQRTGTSGTDSGSVGSQANGNLMFWGSWSSATLADANVPGSPVSPVPATFTAGQVTPTSALSSLSGKRAEYTFVGGTKVYSTKGVEGSLGSGSKLTVDFSGVGSYADVDLLVNFTGANAADYRLRGGVTGTGVGFGGKVEVQSSSCLNNASNACKPGSVEGFFGGSTANYAGLSYQGESTLHGIFGGSAVFGSGSPASTPTNSSLTNLRAHFTSTTTGAFPNYDPQQWFGYNSNPDYYEGTSQVSATPSFTGERLDRFVATYTLSGDSNTLAAGTGTTIEFGALGRISDTDFLGWGRWAQGSRTTTGYGGGTTMLDNVHYLVGAPTPVAQRPTTGTATYALVGGTNPTSSTLGVGTLTSATLSANFGTSQLDFSATAKFGNTTATFSNNTIGAFDQSISGSLIRQESGTCGNATIHGMFTGNLASRAGIVYRSTANVNGTGNVSGTAIFQRSSSNGLGVSAPVPAPGPSIGS